MVSTPKQESAASQAAAQSGLNRDTALTQQQVNMVNQVTPTGNLTYDQTGESSFVDSTGKTVSTPTYTATTTLSPQQQQIFDQSQSAQSNLAGIADQQSSFLKDYLNQPVDLSRSGLKDYIDQNYATDFNNQWDKDQSAQRTQLIASGLRPGTTAYDQAMSEFSNNRSKAYDNLQSDAYTTAMQSKLAERNQPLNEIGALLSGSQVASPTFTSTPTASISSPNYMAAAQANYQSELNSSQSKMGGLFGLLSGGTGLLSDVRAKENIRQVGATNAGVPIYTYNYKGDAITRMGVMAQEIETSNPDAVHDNGPNGLKTVDYGKVY